MLLIRDYRSREMRVLIAAVLCSVICLTAIAFAIDSIRNLLSDTSASLLGGDRVISAPGPIAQEIITLAKNNSSAYTETLTFYSMISDSNNVILSTIKAVAESYPLHGKLYISSAISDIPYPSAIIPEPGTIWLEPRVFVELDLKVGDYVEVGNARLKIAAVLRDEPDRVADGFAFVPRAIINMQDVGQTEAVQAGSRVTYKLLVNGTKAQLDTLDIQIPKLLPVGYKLSSANAEMESFRNLDLAENYLSLAILINIIIAAVAISIAANRYSTVHAIDAAVMRCLGASAKRLAQIFTLGLLLGSLVLGVIGSAIGFIIEQTIAYLLLKYMNLQLPLPGYLPLLYGVLGAMLLVLIAALPAFIKLSKESPMQVLRRGKSNGNSNGWQLKFNFSRRLPALLRLSLNNIFYNAKNNLFQLVAFSFIICVALILFNVRSDLLNNWFAQLPHETPNYFALNISMADKPKMQQFLSNNQISSTDFYPIVRGTLIRINQEVVNTEESQKKNQREGIHRPLNLTWSSSLPFKNQILQGNWFDANELEKNTLSIENELAARLNIKLGDELTFLINTQEVNAKVTSIRSVEWNSLTPNFYVIYPPGMLEDFPHTYLVSFYLPDGQSALLRNMVKEFPSINILSISQMIEQANVVISMLSLVVGFIWLFTLIISLILMLAIVLSGINLRNYQNNLMRILGASKAQIQNMLSIEYVILGAIAGFIGSSIAIALGAHISQRYFNSAHIINWWTMPAGCLAGSIIMWLAGFIATFKSLSTAPIQFTRNN